jgi:hypothetical protein
MSLASPWLLWGLLSLLPLTAIYFLKVRPTRKSTTAWFLWEQVFREQRARTFFRRFRDIISLILLVIAFTAIVFAAARPYWVHASRQDMLLVIDNSASMNTEYRGGTRLDEAKRIAREIVRSLGDNQQCNIATSASTTVFRSSLTDNNRELIEAIDRINSTPLPSSLSALNPLIESVGRDALGRIGGSSVTTSTDEARLTTLAPSDPKDGEVLPRVIFISDGCLGGEAPDSIELLKVGEGTANNLGFVSCDLRRLPLADRPAGVFIQVASTFKETVQVDLALYHDSEQNLVRLTTLEVRPGENPPEIFQIPNATEGKWILKLETKDALPDDNVVFAVLPPDVPIDVAVVAEGKFFYENSVSAFSRGDVLLRLAPEAAADLLVGQANIATNNAPPDADILVFQPGGDSDWWSDAGEEILVALPTVLDDSHPILRHLDANSLPWIGARRLRAPAGAEVLIAAEDGTPLLYRVVTRGRGVVVVNHDPVESDFFLSPWFPVLVYSVAAYFSGVSEAIPATCGTGQVIQISELEAESVQWTAPDGSIKTPSGINLVPLDQTGYYSLSAKNLHRQFGCSLLSRHETMVDNKQIADTSRPVNRGWSPASWLALLAILVVVAESIMYHRRLVG